MRLTNFRTTAKVFALQISLAAGCWNSRDLSSHLWTPVETFSMLYLPNAGCPVPAAVAAAMGASSAPFYDDLRDYESDRISDEQGALSFQHKFMTARKRCWN